MRVEMRAEMRRVFLRTALVALGIAHCVTGEESVARAQSSPGPGADALVVARSLFADALQDEEAGRPAEALEKFERVRNVRDTASIEYRLGSCHEALGQLVAASEAYQAATALAKAGDTASHAVADAASARVDVLSRRVARLTLVTHEDFPAAAEVRLDGTALAAFSLGSPIAVDPGRHTVTATAEGAAPFHTEIALAEGTKMSLTVPLRASPPSQPSPPVAETARGTVGSRIAGRVAVAGGATLALGSTILLVLRNRDIAKLDDACPHGLCPAGSNVNELESTRSRALLEGPLALGFGIAGIAVAAVGIYLLVTPQRSATGAGVTAYVAPIVGYGTPGVTLGGRFR